MKKKKIYLHIGFHKTGTSALQEFLNDNREQLEKNGIFYPRSYGSSYPGNVDLSWAFNPNPPKWGNVTDENRITILDYYMAQIQETKADKIIISSEDFSLLDSNFEIIENIKEYFIDFDVTVISYVREPVDFIFSLYSHAIRSRNISMDLKKYIADVFNFRSGDFPLRLQVWRRVFGKESLVVRKYDPRNFINNSLVDDFFDAISLNNDIKQEMKKSNIGIHPWLINAYIEISSSSLPEDIKNKKLRDLVNLGSDLPKTKALEYLISPEDISIIKNSYQVSYNRLKREYGISFES